MFLKEFMKEIGWLPSNEQSSKNLNKKKEIEKTFIPFDYSTHISNYFINNLI